MSLDNDFLSFVVKNAYTPSNAIINTNTPINTNTNIIEKKNIGLSDFKAQLTDDKKTNQEKYIACLKIWEIYEKEKKHEQGIFYLIESYKYDKTRVEGIYQLVKYYGWKEMPEIAFSFYSLIQDEYEYEYENEYMNSSKKINSWLSPNILEYDFYLPYHMIIICQRIHKYDIGIKMFEIIFNKKRVQVDKWYIGCLLFNLKFFIDKVNNPSFFRLCEDFLNLLYLQYNNTQFIDNSLLCKYANEWLNKDNLVFFSELVEPKQITIDKNIESNKILIYIGFSYNNWNSTYGKHNFLGGSERAVAYVSEYFPKNMEIYVGGAVIEEKFDNIQYINLDNLQEFIKNNKFHAIIISRYIGFFEMFEYIETKQVVVWAHDIYLLPYNSSNKLDDNTIINKWHHVIDKCICLTNWHKERFENRYPLLKDKIQIIANGIEFELFPKKIQLNVTDEINSTRVKNRFIYSSNPNRGLSRILELWEQITIVLPDAELKVVGSKPDDDQLRLINSFSNVEYLGGCNPNKLYEIMATCDIWFYPVTNFEETYCITALEVLYCNVICIYYPIAGLKDTVGEYGIAVERGNEIEVFSNLTEEKKTEMREKGRKYAEEGSWKNRVKIWNKLLENPEEINV
jgi:glycosyltransferase involved in cell wall biosynthesis